METKSGNEVKKNAEPDNPAVHVERSGHNVLKKASELDVEEPGDKHKEDQGESKTVTEDDKEKANGEPQTGDKRPAEDDKKEEGEDAKKQKATNGEPKKKGRPAKNGGAAKKETKKRAPKKAATESGEPRRSGRNATKS